NAFAHLVSDQALQLIPCQAVLFLFHREHRRARDVALFCLATAAIFLTWPAVRLGVYLTHADYPAGIDGTIVFTRPVPWAGVLQPNLLPFTKAHVNLYGMSNSLSPWNFTPSKLITRPQDILLVSRPVAAVLVGGLVLAALMVPGVRRTQAVKWLALAVL